MKKKEFIKNFNSKFETPSDVTREALQDAMDEFFVQFIADYELTREKRAMFIWGRNTNALVKLLKEYQKKYKDIIFEINNHFESLIDERPFKYAGFFEMLKALDSKYITVVKDIPL